MSLYGLIIGLTIIIGYQYFSAHNKIVPKNQETLFVVLGIIFSIIGARAYHVIDQWTYYSHHLLEITATRNGGLGIYGAIIAAILYIIITSKILKFETVGLLDLITPILPLCQAIGRLGNFVNHEIPFWWTESLSSLVLFLLIRKFPRNPTAKYFIGYGIIRFCFEFLRNDTWAVSELKVAQLISIIFILVGIKLLRDQRHKIS